MAAKDIKPEDAQKASRLLRTLRGSIDVIEQQHAQHPEKELAIYALRHAIARLEEPRHNCYDVHAYTVYFLSSLSKEKRVEVAHKMRNNGFTTLSILGARKPTSLQKFFADMGIECPLPLLVFNKEYQHEIRLVKSVPPRVPPALLSFTAPAPSPI